MAQVELAILDDGVRPRRAFGGWRRELALDAESLRRGLDEHDRAAVVAEDHASVGIEHGRRAGRRGLRPPGNPPGGQLDADRFAPVRGAAANANTGTNTPACLIFLVLRCRLSYRSASLRQGSVSGEQRMRTVIRLRTAVVPDRLTRFALLG